MADASALSPEFSCCVCLENQPVPAQCRLACSHGPCRACTLAILARLPTGSTFPCPVCSSAAPSTCTLKVALFESPSRLEVLENVSVFASREDVLARIAADACVDASRIRALTVRGSALFKPHTTLLENHVCCGDGVVVWVLFKQDA